MNRINKFRLLGMIFLIAGLTGCNTDLDEVANGNAGGVGVKIAQEVIDNVTQTLDTALNACKDNSLGKTLPSASCEGRQLGDGLKCPETNEHDLPELSGCSYEYFAEVDVAIAGLGKGMTKAKHTIETKSTSNKSLTHTHQQLSEIATRCVDPYVYWRVVVDQMTKITVQVSVGGTIVDVNVAGGSKGTRTGLALCGTKNHGEGESLTCGPG